MNDKPVELYLIGGIAGFFGSLLMIASGYLGIFQIQGAYLGEANQKMAFIASHPLVGITHGLSVLSLLLIVPTVVAVFVLLNIAVTARSFLGTGFALLWLSIEMVGHLSQTAPLRGWSELYKNMPTREMAAAIYSVSGEFWEAFSRAGTCLSALMSLCYGLILIKDWNRPAGYLFLIAFLAFPIGLLIPRVGMELHVILRGIAFIIVSGVLIQVATKGE
ncbi:hypothetical protein IH992_07740 [Candidatus Poribacteria bacterium]|nr:hypothetical protein [Candidatus Poribacteria bacterium]